jgi:hypothetical protein
MVHIKHTAHAINISVPSEMKYMASDEALEVSALRREASAEVTSSQRLEDFDYCESRSDGSEDTESASDDLEHAKVATDGITFNFGASGVGKAHITSVENNTRYFSKGYSPSPHRA